MTNHNHNRNIQPPNPHLPQINPSVTSHPPSSIPALTPPPTPPTSTSSPPNPHLHPHHQPPNTSLHFHSPSSPQPQTSTSIPKRRVPKTFDEILGVTPQNTTTTKPVRNCKFFWALIREHVTYLREGKSRCMFGLSLRGGEEKEGTLLEGEVRSERVDGDKEVEEEREEETGSLMRSEVLGYVDNGSEAIVKGEGPADRRFSFDVGDEKMFFAAPREKKRKEKRKKGLWR